jgi:hypothetical protein
VTRTGIGGGRKAAYYLGTLMMVAGFLIAFGSFIPAFSIFGSTQDFVGQTMSGASRGKPPDSSAVTGFMGQVTGSVAYSVGLALGGTALIIVGAFIRRTGSHGLAGSGLVLDPQRAREDVKPWSQMQGGVLRDTIDAAGLGGAARRPGGGAADLPFDEKLRRLHKLREEGLISEEEYQRERREVLDSN